MAKLKIGPNGVVASVDALLSTFLNTTNCGGVYEVDGQYKSWKPGRDLNAINSIKAGIGYIVIAFQEVDLTAYFTPETTDYTFEYVEADSDGNVII